MWGLSCRHLVQGYRQRFLGLDRKPRERTDHTHLGQLLTYAAGLKTVTIVWIAQRFTDEHRAALDWLNEVTGDEINFFGLEVELWRIGESAIAPKFNIVSKANEWTKGKAATGHVSGDKGSDTKKLQLEYWQQFRDYVTENSSVMKPQKPAPCHWMNFSIGTSRAYPHVLLNTRDKMISFGCRLTRTPKEWRFSTYCYRTRKRSKQRLGRTWTGRNCPRSKPAIFRKPNSDPCKSNWAEQQAWMLEKLGFSARPLDCGSRTWMSTSGRGGHHRSRIKFTEAQSACYA